MNAAGSNSAHLPLQDTGSAPSLDGHRGAGADLQRIGAEHIDHDLQIARVSDLDHRGSRRNDSLALLGYPEDHAGNWCGHIPSVASGILGLVVARQHGPGLPDLVLGGMILEFRCAQLALGHSRGKLGALERLRRRHATSRQAARALQVGPRLIRLGASAVDCGPRAFPGRLGGAEPLFGFPAAARIENWRRGRQDRRQRVADTNTVARLQANARGQSAEWRRHDIAFPHAGLSVLVDGRDEWSLGHQCGVDHERNSA